MRLRPSMRENYRYILARISPPTRKYDAKEIYLAASEAFTSLFGEIESSRAWIAVMECSSQYVIFRFRRGLDIRVEAAVASISHISDLSVAIHPVKKSGTIRTLREDIKKNLTASVRDGSIKHGNTWYSAVFSHYGEIDLKEKGINLQIPLYITEEDIEDRHYDE